MIERTTIAWFVAGLVAGLLHAIMLRRTTHRLTAWTPVLGMLRLGVVATVLVVAARSGTILASATGWTLGFVTVVMWFAMSRANGATAPPSSQSGEQRNQPNAS